MKFVMEEFRVGANGFLALCLSSWWNTCVYSRVVAESDPVPEHERVAADPASVETCPYFDAYTEGGEDVTLQCRILDLVGGGRGVVSVFFCVAGGNLSVSPNPAPPRRRPPPSPRAAAGSLRDVGEVFTWGQISADENMFVVALSVSFGRCCLRVRVLSRHFGFSFTPSRTKISVGFFLQNERSEVDAAIYVATGTRGAALK